jgi:hypothetical protein
MNPATESGFTDLLQSTRGRPGQPEADGCISPCTTPTGLSMNASARPSALHLGEAAEGYPAGGAGAGPNRAIASRWK